MGLKIFVSFSEITCKMLTLILVDYILFELAKFSSGVSISARIYIYALYICVLSGSLSGIAHKIHSVNQASHAV